VAWWSTKSAISLKRVKIEEKFLWRAYRKSPLQRCFERYHPRPPTASPSLRLGVRNPTPKLQSLLSQERLKYGLQIWPIHLQGPSEHKPMKNFGEKGAWSYPGTAQFFEYPLVSQERVKLRTSIFGKSSRLLVRTLEIFQGTHILGALRGRLCDSSALLLLHVSRCLLFM